MARPPGRKPTPSNLRLVTGSNLNRINPAEPKIPRGLPKPPKSLDELAREVWEETAPMLYQSGVLTKGDRYILGCYCQAVARWMEAEEALRAFRAEMKRKQQASGQVDPASGFLVTTINGNVIHNPLVGIANKAAADVARYATDLGLTPSARSRVKSESPGDEDDPASKYFA